MPGWGEAFGGFMKGYQDTIAQRHQERQRQFDTLMRASDDYMKHAQMERAKGPMANDDLARELEAQAHQAAFDAEKAINQKVGGLAKVGLLLGIGRGGSKGKGASSPQDRAGAVTQMAGQPGTGLSKPPEEPAKPEGRPESINTPPPEQSMTPGMASMEPGAGPSTPVMTTGFTNAGPLAGRGQSQPPIYGRPTTMGPTGGVDTALRGGRTTQGFAGEGPMAREGGPAYGQPTTMGQVESQTVPTQMTAPPREGQGQPPGAPTGQPPAGQAGGQTPAGQEQKASITRLAAAMPPKPEWYPSQWNWTKTRLEMQDATDKADAAREIQRKYARQDLEDLKKEMGDGWNKLSEQQRAQITANIMTGKGFSLAGTSYDPWDRPGKGKTYLDPTSGVVMFQPTTAAGENVGDPYPASLTTATQTQFQKENADAAQYAANYGVSVEEARHQLADQRFRGIKAKVGKQELDLTYASLRNERTKLMNEAQTIKNEILNGKRITLAQRLSVIRAAHANAYEQLGPLQLMRLAATDPAGLEREVRKGVDKFLQDNNFPDLDTLMAMQEGKPAPTDEEKANKFVDKETKGGAQKPVTPKADLQ